MKTASIFVGIALAGLATSAVAAPKTLYYGSRVGMVVTVMSASGLGSANAVIHAVHTRENAETFCKEYAHDPSEKCVKTTLAIPLADKIAANCKTGVFTTFNGLKLKFEGLNAKDKQLGAKYKLVELASGQALDGTEASGYPYQIEQFIALCPGQATSE